MNKYNSTQAEQITKIANYLEQQRLKQGLTLEDIASTTFIRLPMLKALENGDIEQLPELIYVQGFIRRYGDAVKLDGNALSQQITDSNQEKKPISANLVAPPVIESKVGQEVPPTLVNQDHNQPVAVKSKPRTLPHPSQETSETSGGSWVKRLQLYWVYLLVLGGAIAGLFYLLSRPPATEKTAQTQQSKTVATSPQPQANPETPPTLTPQETKPVATTPKTQESPQPVEESTPVTKPETIISSEEPSPILEPTPETPTNPENTAETPTPTTPSNIPPNNATTAPEPPKPTSTTATNNQPNPETTIKAALQLEGDSWLQVKVDGKVEYEGILEQGTQQSWDAQENLTIRAGNAGAVKLSVNNKPPQSLGELGEVKSIEITPDR